jgi:hypothetical protein
MLTAARLSQLAHEFADQARGLANHYEAQLRQLKIEQTDIEAKLRAANLSRKRFTDFQAEIDGQFQCPVVGLITERDLALSRFPALPARTCSDAMNVILRFRLLPRTIGPATCRAPLRFAVIRSTDPRPGPAEPACQDTVSRGKKGRPATCALSPRHPIHWRNGRRDERLFFCKL